MLLFFFVKIFNILLHFIIYHFILIASQIHSSLFHRNHLQFFLYYCIFLEYKFSVIFFSFLLFFFLFYTVKYIYIFFSFELYFVLHISTSLFYFIFLIINFLFSSFLFSYFLMGSIRFNCVHFSALVYLSVDMSVCSGFLNIFFFSPFNVCLLSCFCDLCLYTIIIHVGINNFFF